MNFRFLSSIETDILQYVPKVYYYIFYSLHNISHTTTYFVIVAAKILDQLWKYIMHNLKFLENHARYKYWPFYLSDVILPTNKPTQLIKTLNNFPHFEITGLNNHRIPAKCRHHVTA